MTLPPAPAGAVNFLMGGPPELATARAVPSPDYLSGQLRDAARAARRAVTTYDEIHAAGRALVDARPRVHSEDERIAARLMAGGKALGEAKLLLHDAELADEAERLSAAAGAVAAAVRALEAVPEDQWQKAAGKVGGQVAQHVGQAEDALATARKVLASVGGIANVQAWTERRHVVPDSRVSRALDSLDAAQEAVARVRDGDPAPDPNLISPPVHSGMSGAWAQATSPVGG